MNEKPKSIWKKPRTGWRSSLLWILIVSIAAFLFAVLLAIFTSVKTTLFDKHSGLENFVGYGLIVWFWFLIAVAFVLAFYGIARWFFCWRNLKRFLFGLACFATLVALFYVEEDWRGKHDWKKFQREWAAKGENFDWQSVVPPAVPDDENFALTPVVASCYETYFDKSGHAVQPRNTNVVDRLSLISWREDSYENKRPKIPESDGWRAATKMDLKARQDYFRTPPPTNSIQTNCYPVAPQPQMPAADVLLALSKYDSTIEEIRQASRLPYSRFPLTYDEEDKFAILLPHLAALKTCEQTVSLRAVAELQMGRTEPACEDARLGLYLANALRSEPFIISQLVGKAMLEIALQPVWEGLAGHRWSESQLIALDAELMKFDLLADCHEAMRAEIVSSAEEANYLRRHRDYVVQFAQNNFRYTVASRYKFSIYRHIPGGWFYQSALRNGRSLVQYFPAVNREARTISPELIRRADTSSVKAGYFDPLETLREMFNAKELFMGNFLEKIAVGQSSVDLARTAIALERYRLAHGEYPESLDALAPQFIAQVPHDVIGGGPLKYRREQDGQFVLYSIGWNETDDGGVVVMGKGKDPGDKSNLSVEINKGDWVWRYPAR